VCNNDKLAKTGYAAEFKFYTNVAQVTTGSTAYRGANYQKLNLVYCLKATTTTSRDGIICLDLSHL